MSIEKYMDDQILAGLHEIDIDMGIGVKYCGDQDFYMEVLTIAYQVYLERYPQLNSYYENKDFKNYTILVHSIKSGAANIGAMKLSDMARALEEAGKNNDCEFIEDNHKKFILYYYQLMEALAKLLDLTGDKDSVKENEPVLDITYEEWKATLERINYYLKELELDMAEELIEQLLECKRTVEEMDILRYISKALGNFDVEGAKEKLCILMKK